MQDGLSSYLEYVGMLPNVWYSSTAPRLGIFASNFFMDLIGPTRD